MSAELLEALAARCEHEDPDIILDCSIFDAVGNVPWGRYTQSLDAAEQLVPKGYCWSLDTDPDVTPDGPEAGVGIPLSRQPLYRQTDWEFCHARTAPLALCAAALRARAAFVKQREPSPSQTS